MAFARPGALALDRAAAFDAENAPPPGAGAGASGKRVARGLGLGGKAASKENAPLSSSSKAALMLSSTAAGTPRAQTQALKTPARRALGNITNKTPATAGGSARRAARAGDAKPTSVRKAGPSASSEIAGLSGEVSRRADLFASDPSSWSAPGTHDAACTSPAAGADAADEDDVENWFGDPAEKQEMDRIIAEALEVRSNVEAFCSFLSASARRVAKPPGGFGSLGEAEPCEADCMDTLTDALAFGDADAEGEDEDLDELIRTLTRGDMLDLP